MDGGPYWMMICTMQTSPETAVAERRAWKAYAAALCEPG